MDNLNIRKIVVSSSFIVALLSSASHARPSPSASGHYYDIVHALYDNLSSPVGQKDPQILREAVLNFAASDPQSEPDTEIELLIQEIYLQVRNWQAEADGQRLNVNRVNQFQRILVIETQNRVGEAGVLLTIGSFAGIAVSALIRHCQPSGYYPTLATAMGLSGLSGLGGLSAVHWSGDSHKDSINPLIKRLKKIPFFMEIIDSVLLLKESGEEWPLLENKNFQLIREEEKKQRMLLAAQMASSCPLF